MATAAGVNQTSATDLATTSPTFGDYDLDGDLELFVCAWDDRGMTDGNRLFRNDGDGTFTDISEIWKRP